jgi:hypothetical protein
MKISLHYFSSLALLSVLLLLNGNANGQSEEPKRKACAESQTNLKTTDETPKQKSGHLRKNDLQSGTGRGCTIDNRSNPYSISRKDFGQLPPDQQIFILNNPDKYPITD